MTHAFSRRALLGGGAAAVAALGLPWSSVVHAAGRELVVRLDKDISNLDPAYRTGPVDANVIRAVHQALIRFKPGSLEWELDAAERIEQVSDTLIAFALKPGLKFTGGYGDLTADDVKFSFERFTAPARDGGRVPYADDWAVLTEVEVTGPLSGRIHLSAPSAALWTITLPGSAGSIVSRKAYDALGDAAATAPIGSGAYLLKEWTPRDHLTLAANPDYAGAPPHFETIVARPIPEDKTAELAFRSGEIAFTRVDPASAEEAASGGDAKILRFDGIDYIWIGPNIEKKPFDDIRVRQAIRKAIDVDAIIAGAYAGTVKRARALEAPGLLGYWADAPLYERDVEGARALLAEAGLEGGFSTVLTVLNGAIPQATAAIVQANLAEIGIDVQINALDGGAYWAYGENDASRDLELVLVEYNGELDPGFQTQWFTADQIGKWNWQRWNSPEFDALHREGATTTDPAKRQEIYVAAQKLQDESAAFVWITHNTHAFAARTWLNPAILPNGSQWQYPAFSES